MASLIHMNLSGMLPPGEKRKALNQFVRRAQKHEVANILKDCEGLASSQYNLVKFLLADKFRHFDLMMELLYDGDTAIMSVVVSKRWLYEEDQNSLTDSEFLLNKLFPNVSYNCRLKVLNKIGRYEQNEAKVDRIWNAIDQRYGFEAAFPLLQACSKNIISAVLAKRKVDLSGYQLVRILEKYPDVGLEYLKNNNVRGSKMNPYCSPLQYLYNNRPDDFVDLCVSRSDKIQSFKIGRNRTTNIIRTYRDKLLQHPTKATSLLKFDRIRREFSSEDFQTLFESTLPHKPCEVNRLWQWINTVPLDRRVEMVNRAFKKIYQINLDDHPQFMSPEYFVLLPDEKRLSVVEWKSENDQNYGWTFKSLYVYCYKDEEKKRAWLPLKPISHSVPELQKLLLIEQDVTNRTTLSKYLIETCYINKDLPQLLNVLQLLSKRCRNDQSEVRNQIFDALVDIVEKMEFTKEHWDIILEMIRVSLVFDDINSDSEKEMLVRKCIAFRLDNELPLDDLVTMHIKLKIQCNEWSWTESFIKKPEDRRALLELYIKELENLQLTDNLCGYNGVTVHETESTKIILKLIEAIKNFNDNDGSSLEPILMSSHPWLLTNMERIAREEETRLEEYCKEPNNTFPWKHCERIIEIVDWLKEEENLLMNFFTGPDYILSRQLLCSPTHTIIMHYLRKNPVHLLPNWSAILTKLLARKACVPLMKKLKSWNYSTLVDQSIEICSEIMNGTLDTGKVEALEIPVRRRSRRSRKSKPPKRNSVKCNAVLVLSVLKEPSAFLELTVEYYPQENQVNVAAEKSDEDYKLRETFAYALINVAVPHPTVHLTFEAVKKFCVGDYLKLSIGTLYSQMSRAPSAKSLDYLREQLVDVPVSLQKHMIRLYCVITSVDDKCRTLKRITSANVSIRYVVFLQANKLFRSSPSQETWTILKAIIENTSIDDQYIWKYLQNEPQLDNLPIEYISEFIGNCLALLRKLEPPNAHANFIQHVQSIIDKVPAKTLDEILLYDYENADSFISTFCVAYLRHSSSESILEHRLSNMWCLLNSVIGRSWDDEELLCSTRPLIFTFIQSLCCTDLNSSKAWLHSQIFRTLIDKLKAMSTTKFFKEILYLDLASLMVAIVTCSDTVQRLRRFGRSIAMFVDSLVTTFGGEVVFIALDTIKYFAKNYFSHAFTTYDFLAMVDEILATSRTRQNQIISVNFVNGAKPESAHLKEMLGKIYGILNESNDEIVQAYYASINH